MAGRGRAPKPADQRRRRNTPARGEWVDLPSLDGPVLPEAKRAWTPQAKMMWAAWRQDPVTLTYGPADIAAITMLADGLDDLLPSEQRLRMDGLGLTPKGRRDLRYRLPGEQLDAEPAAPALAVVTPIDLKVVKR